MQHLFFSPGSTTAVCALLIKNRAFRQHEIVDSYVTPLENLGVGRDKLVAFSLDTDNAKRTSAAFAKEYAKTLLRALDRLGVMALYVADSTYFKLLAGKRKADPEIGYSRPCVIEGYEHMCVVLGVNHQQLIYDPRLLGKLQITLETLASCFHGNYQAPGQGVIHSGLYPETPTTVKEALTGLLKHSKLTCDIEAFSLDFLEAGIGTIAFAWDKHNGMAFPVDYLPQGFQGLQTRNTYYRDLLRKFFEDYQGELVFHNAGYDVKVLVYNLWMEHPRDMDGLLTGLDIMTRHFHDTKLIAYLATNSTAGNTLSLKSLAQEFAGNWAVEVTDIRTQPLAKLLTYNLVDALSTHYVFDKYYPKMVEDQQEELYKTLFLPSQKLLIQTEIVGIPISRKRVQEVRSELEGIRATHAKVLQENAFVGRLNGLLQVSIMEATNAKLKVKQHPLEHFKDVTYNQNSALQNQRLLYEVMELPVLDCTDTGAPATGADTIAKLVYQTKDPEKLAVLEALSEYSTVDIVLSTFIPAFENAAGPEGDDIAWLHGNFNLGGTVSGRLSSSGPNLQNLPAGNTGSKTKQYCGKLIKSCVVTASGWLFGGADFHSLEAMVDALVTRDENKLAVYTSHMDSHSWNAFGYWPQKMPDIAEALSKLDEPGKFYKVIDEDGTISYVHEADS